jgi:hypothetical protein
MIKCQSGNNISHICNRFNLFYLISSHNHSVFILSFTRQYLPAKQHGMESVSRATTPEFIHEHYHHVFETLIAVLFIVQSRTFSQKLSFLFYILLEHSLTYWAINSSLFRSCVLCNNERLNKTKTADDTNLLISQSLDIDSNYKSIWSMVIKQSNDQSGFISRSHRDYFRSGLF